MKDAELVRTACQPPRPHGEPVEPWATRSLPRRIESPVQANAWSSLRNPELPYLPIRQGEHEPARPGEGFALPVGIRLDPLGARCEHVGHRQCAMGADGFGIAPFADGVAADKAAAPVVDLAILGEKIEKGRRVATIYRRGEGGQDFGTSLIVPSKFPLPSIDNEARARRRP